MQVSIINPTHETLLFGIIFGVVLLGSLVRKQNYTSLSLTQELKGLAILTVLFGHIGYFLATDHAFMFPFSILSGVGVNLFLFLSGYGLTLSEIKKGSTILTFYKKRLIKLFVPFWIVLASFLILDALLLKITYPIDFIYKAVFGVFTHANIWTDFNSPFWYFTFILINYLLFPIFFNKKHTWITALLLYISIKTLVEMQFSFFTNVIGNYEVHMLAFPLGVFCAWLTNREIKTPEILVRTYKKFELLLYPILGVSLLAAIAYFAVYSDVGNLPAIEQRTSLITVALIISFFALKKQESKLLSLFGLYSYEIYLFHWPLLYRYDVLYTHLPGAIATLIYLCVFILLAKMLSKVTATIHSYISPVAR